MSNYYDPSWYEQGPDHNDRNMPSPQQPAPDGFSIYPPTPPETADNRDNQSNRGKFYEDIPNPQRQKSRSRRILGQILLFSTIIVIAFFAGWFSHQAFGGTFYQSDQSRLYSGMIQQAWDAIDQNYVDRKAVDYKQMSYKAIQAMVAVLNDKGHTRFLTPTDVQNENQSLSGSYTGIGIYLHQDTTTKQVSITSTIPGSPAEKTGLKRGDIVVAVDGTDTTSKDIPSISTLIHGQEGTKVAITIERPSTHQRLTFHITRARIQVPNVLMHYISEDHIAHIQIVQFADGVSAQLKDAIMQAKKMGATKIILDLRDDPGGYLKEAIDTASEFMQSGNVLLEQDKTGERTPVAVTGNTVDTHIPIVVLINNNTASAAEIVTGALKDNHRAEVIGEKTYGTGTVLQEFSLADGSALLIGTQEWLTPNGHFIRDLGIQPDILVKESANTPELTPNDENSGNMSEQQILKSGDTQLVGAIQYLENQH
ncbi:MAG: S41 family peptidase [Chloroflexota bacterium]|nr:S41 family peptidase [Chloroflexota bacterium]